MNFIDQTPGRRSFIKTAAAAAAGMTGLSLLPSFVQAGPPGLSVLPEEEEEGIIGPREGYSPYIGTLVSMMAFMRSQVLASTKGMTVEQLDWLMDNKANTIGSLLYHLAATNAFYFENTFNGVADEKNLSEDFKNRFGVAMELGDKAREAIKGHPLEFYLGLLKETREKTLAEFRKRDDKWLMTVDKEWKWNNFAKWFHVCEHEGNHNGQIKLLKSRLPGAKAGGNG